jgi:hypothetical protein
MKIPGNFTPDTGPPLRYMRITLAVVDNYISTADHVSITYDNAVPDHFTLQYGNAALSLFPGIHLPGSGAGHGLLSRARHRL